MCVLPIFSRNLSDLHKTDKTKENTFLPHESYIKISVVSAISQFIGKVSSEFHFNAIGPINQIYIKEKIIPLNLAQAAL